MSGTPQQSACSLTTTEVRRNRIQKADRLTRDRLTAARADIAREDIASGVYDDDDVVGEASRRMAQEAGREMNSAEYRRGSARGINADDDYARELVRLRRIERTLAAAILWIIGLGAVAGVGLLFGAAL
jgi:hypothetical protein